MSSNPPFTPPYSVAYDMNRRAYLSTIATTTLGSLSGCLISGPSLYTITDRPTLSDDSGFTDITLTFKSGKVLPDRVRNNITIEVTHARSPAFDHLLLLLNGEQKEHRSIATGETQTQLSFEETVTRPEYPITLTVVASTGGQIQNSVHQNGRIVETADYTIDGDF